MSCFHRLATCVLAMTLVVPMPVLASMRAQPEDLSAETPPAPAEPMPESIDAQADAAIEDARARFDAGDFDGAIAAFERAYGLRANANLIYNIGRVQEEAGRIELALEQYRRFVREPGVDLALREKAVERIDVLRRILDATRPTEPPPDPVVAPPSAPAPASVPPRPRPPDDGGALRLGGGVVAGLGAATLAAGGIVGGLALRDANTLEGTDDPGDRGDLVTRGRRLAISADVLYGVGAGVALVGFIVAMAGVERGRAARRGRVAVSADLGPGYAAAGIALPF